MNADLPLVAALHYGGHERQPNPWGCIVRSLFALTAEPAVLEHEDDCNIAAHFARLPGSCGLTAFTLAKTPDLSPLGREFWAEYLGWLAVYDGDGPAFAHLLLGVPSERSPAHVVGAVACAAGVVVLDPAADGERRYDLDGLLASKYGRAFEAHELQPADPAGHAWIDGPTAPHVRSTRERWARTVLDQL